MKPEERQRVIREAFRVADVEGLLALGAPGDEYDHEADDALETSAIYGTLWTLREQDVVRIVRDVLRR